jgi:hypothetical protein
MIKTILSSTWECVKNFLKSKRMKSFYWRTGVMFVTVVSAAVIDSGMTGYIPVLIGLALAEVTKGLNNYITENSL